MTQRGAIRRRKEPETPVFAGVGSLRQHLGLDRDAPLSIPRLGCVGDLVEVPLLDTGLFGVLLGLVHERRGQGGRQDQLAIHVTRQQPAGVRAQPAGVDIIDDSLTTETGER